MSIKPVDHNTMIPKTLELSNARNVEILKNRNIVESGFFHQERVINRNKSKVLDVEKKENVKVQDEQSKRHNDSQSKKKKSNKTLKTSKNTQKSRNRIDIRI